MTLNDNSSAIHGFETSTLQPEYPLQVRASVHVAHPAVRRDSHPPLRRGDEHGRPHPRRAGDGHGRDVQATGTGAKVTASTVGYWVGALNIPGYELPWEEKWEYPSGRGLLA